MTGMFGIGTRSNKILKKEPGQKTPGADVPMANKMVLGILRDTEKRCSLKLKIFSSQRTFLNSSKKQQFIFFTP